MATPDAGWAASGDLLRYTAAGRTGVTTACPSPVLGVAALARADVCAISLFTVCHYDGTTWTSTALDIPRSGP